MFPKNKWGRCLKSSVEASSFQTVLDQTKNE